MNLWGDRGRTWRSQSWVWNCGTSLGRLEGVDSFEALWGASTWSVPGNGNKLFGEVLKMQSVIQFQKKLIFELNSQLNDTPPFRAPCWLAWIVYGSYTFVSHLQGQGCIWRPEFFERKHWNTRRLDDRVEQLAEFDKKCVGLELPTAPLNLQCEC